MTIKPSLLAALIVSSLMAVGCAIDVGDLVKTKVPAPVQMDRNLPPKVTLNQGGDEYHAWREEVRRIDAQWRNELRQGEEAAAVISDAALQFATVGEGALLASAPWAAPLIPLGLYALGLFTRRPGDKTAKEADDLYVEGSNDAVVLMREGKEL